MLKKYRKFPRYIFKSSIYKKIEFLSGRGSGAHAVVNVATVEFRFGAVVFIEKLMFNVD